MRIVKERIGLAGVGTLLSGAGSADNLKEYGDRVAKYVPAEIIAGYITLNGLVDYESHAILFPAVIFIICAALTPMYIIQYAKTKKEKIYNGGIALLAFIVWAYASGGGFFKILDIYDAPTASAILVIFSLASGRFVPTTTQPPAQMTLLNNNQKSH